MFAKIWMFLLIVGSYISLFAGMYYALHLRMYNCFLLFFLAQFLYHRYSILALCIKINDMEKLLLKKETIL